MNKMVMWMSLSCPLINQRSVHFDQVQFKTQKLPDDNRLWQCWLVQVYAKRPKYNLTVGWVPCLSVSFSFLAFHEDMVGSWRSKEKGRVLKVLLVCKQGDETLGVSFIGNLRLNCQFQSPKCNIGSLCDQSCFSVAWQEKNTKMYLQIANHRFF